jgi:hypothetical protein
LGGAVAKRSNRPRFHGASRFGVGLHTDLAGLRSVSTTPSDASTIAARIRARRIACNLGSA